MRVNNYESRHLDGEDGSWMCEVCDSPIHADQPHVLCSGCPFSAIHRGECLTTYREATGNVEFKCDMCEEFGSESSYGEYGSESDDGECPCPYCVAERAGLPPPDEQMPAELRQILEAIMAADTERER